MSQKTQHTPEPWKLQGNGTLLHPVSNRPLTTTRIETSLGTFEILDETNEPEQNAALIIAAPELLEACKGLNGLTIERCEQCDGTGKRNNTSDACGICGGVGEVVSGHFHPDELRAIRAAIAKAGGVQ